MYSFVNSLCLTASLRHLMRRYGIAGSGAIYHTLNPRLFAKDLEYIINHAEVALTSQLALLETLAGTLLLCSHLHWHHHACDPCDRACRGCIELIEVDQWQDLAPELHCGPGCVRLTCMHGPNTQLTSHVRKRIIHAIATSECLTKIPVKMPLVCVMQDSVLLFDASFIDMVERMQPHIPTVKTFIMLTHRPHMQRVMQGHTLDCLCFDDIIQAEEGNLSSFQWTPVDENAACGLCFTSGTTGQPKVGSTFVAAVQAVSWLPPSTDAALTA